MSKVQYIIKHWFPSNETKSWWGESYCMDTLSKAFVEQYIVTQFYSQASRPLHKKVTQHLVRCILLVVSLNSAVSLKWFISLSKGYKLLLYSEILKNICASINVLAALGTTGTFYPSCPCMPIMS